MDIVLDSVKVMVLGMGTVFVVLIGLVFIIKALHRLTDKSASKAEQVFEPAQKSDAVNNAVQLQERVEEDEELVAVIAAAVAASLHRSTHDIVVRSIKRVPAITPIWNRVGRQEQIVTRL
ncbi:sodium pump decarboxylase gamma subunit [Caldicoprobacter guelmensis]|uniref:OadG family protein n=1 Tax=Caldicoprobacter guelmensis TaxID=1170224 RepID=UPI00195B71EB|nr:OadG family protein [Caldicoprobacter guelmensis]MBM7581327.1 sodium pump decarboxylase gamma subunit [Caldicoprobacter guelmensis]